MYVETVDAMRFVCTYLIGSGRNTLLSAVDRRLRITLKKRYSPL